MSRGYAIETRRGFPFNGVTVVDETPQEAAERQSREARWAREAANIEEAEERTGHWDLLRSDRYMRRAE